MVAQFRLKAGEVDRKDIKIAAGIAELLNAPELVRAVKWRQADVLQLRGAMLRMDEDQWGEAARVFEEIIASDPPIQEVRCAISNRVWLELVRTDRAPNYDGLRDFVVNKLYQATADNAADRLIRRGYEPLLADLARFEFAGKPNSLDAAKEAAKLLDQYLDPVIAATSPPNNKYSHSEVASAFGFRGVLFERAGDIDSATKYWRYGVWGPTGKSGHCYPDPSRFPKLLGFPAVDVSCGLVCEGYFLARATPRGEPVPERALRASAQLTVSGSAAFTPLFDLVVRKLGLDELERYLRAYGEIPAARNTLAKYMAHQVGFGEFHRNSPGWILQAAASSGAFRDSPNSDVWNFVKSEITYFIELHLTEELPMDPRQFKGVLGQWAGDDYKKNGGVVIKSVLNLARKDGASEMKKQTINQLAATIRALFALRYEQLGQLEDAKKLGDNLKDKSDEELNPLLRAELVRRGVISE